MSGENHYDPLLTMTALNLAIVSLHRITSTNSRVILDQEYRNIINNLRIGEINADPELTELYREIVRVIHRGKLRNEAREMIESKYSAQKSKSIREIISGKILSSFDTSPLKWLGNLAMSCASEYFSELKNCDIDEKIGVLRTEELDEYDTLQRKLLDSSWKLLRHYNLPDNYRLTQDYLEKFYNSGQEIDPQKRLRMLAHFEADFRMYAPYWFYRAQAAQELNDNDEATKCFDNFNEVWRPVLRKCPYKAEALKFRINELIRKGFTCENANEIFLCLAELKANIRFEDWANNIYVGMVYFWVGRKLASDCVMCNIDFGYETEISRNILAQIKPELSTHKQPEPVAPEPVVIPKPVISQHPGKFLRPVVIVIVIILALGSVVSIFHHRNKTPSPPVNIPSNEVSTTSNDDPEEMFNTGWRYANGDGVEKDDTIAAYWYRKSAELGYAPAQFNLGLMYSNGEGVEQDDEQAVYWYRLAANQGNSYAQCNLGYMYGTGRGVVRDYDQAVYYYRKAVDQNNTHAKYNLAVMYENGWGVEEDYERAVFLYRQAANEGDTNAHEALIRLNER